MGVVYVHAHNKLRSNKNFILDVGMEKEQKQDLGWRVSVLPIPEFHHCEPLMCCMYVHSVYSGMQEWVIQIPSISILVSAIPTSRIKFLLLVHINICTRIYVVWCIMEEKI